MNILYVSPHARGTPAIGAVASVTSIDAAIAKARELGFALDAAVIDSTLDGAAFQAACPRVPIVPLEATAEPVAVELAVTRARLHDLEAMLAGMLGHDVRTPLHAITLGCDLLDVRAPDASPAIDRVRRAASRASSIVDDLLDAAQLRLGGELDMTFETVELVALVEHVVAEQHAGQPKRALSFAKPQEPSTVRADVARLERVVAQVIGLVVQHSMTSSHLTVEFVRHRDRVEVLVRCGGVLGEPRANGSTSVGLAVAEVVLRAHGGSLSIERSDRSTARIVLPL